jgi:hypothetical protein
MLLLAAATLQETSQQHNLQQLQQQLALCRQYQQQFQQAAAKLGLSSELMAAVAAWFTEAEQCSSSSSEGVAAGSDAAADCLAVVCTASLLFWMVYPLISSLAQISKHFSAAEQRLVADLYLQVCHIRVATFNPINHPSPSRILYLFFIGFLSCHLLYISLTANLPAWLTQHGLCFKHVLGNKQLAKRG